MPNEILEKVRRGELQPWWNLDNYFVAFLAEQLTKLRDEGHGFSTRFKSSDDWDAYLSNLIDKLEAYDVDEPVAYAEAQTALHEFVSHLSDFWD